MQKRDALKLANRDEVFVRAASGRWVAGWVVGSPRAKKGRVIVPVESHADGYVEVDHVDVK